MYLIFDTETTGLPKNYNAPITDTDNWPRCVQIAWQLHDHTGKMIDHQDYLIQPDGYDIPFQSEQIHGISTELAHEKGIPLVDALAKFADALNQASFVVGQNVGFDVNVMGCELFRMQVETALTELPILDTCTELTAQLCRIPGGRGGRFKLPTLTELHEHLFGEPFAEAHNATADVEATTRCFLELIRIRSFSQEQLLLDDERYSQFFEANTSTIATVGLNHMNLKKESDRIRQKQQPAQAEQLSKTDLDQNLADLADVSFSHLHNHSQYSILQATSEIQALVAAAAKNQQPAVALTDHGNMMAAYHFTMAASKHNKAAKAKNEELIADGKEPTEQEVTAIVGCEFFVCRDRTDKSVKDNGAQVVLLAKNKKGYHNLAKLSSIAATEGFYYVPRIDKRDIEQYKEDVICLTGNLYGDVPNLILNVGEKQAEESLLWWKEQFGDDLYIELMRHGQEDEDRVNQILISFAKKHNIALLASNNTYYVSQKDANAHDILLCVKDGVQQSMPIGRGRGFRYGLPNQEYYFKSNEEMKELFKDLPEAITNTQKIVDQCERYTLARDVLLPKYDIPEEFVHAEDEEDGGKRGENAYLRHLTYVGAEKRYDEITDDIRERLDFELETIERTGYPGYFLIVQDFTTAAREMGVSVGPGRGSAAGSAVAYCIGITNVDPIKYDLLFERFLNPDRVSLPDIDIDFDDEGRQAVIDYVIDKYGENQVAQIITYGTMAAKSAIRDTGRVMELPLPDTDAVAKLVPDMKLSKLFKLDDAGLKEKLKGNVELLEKAEALKKLSEGTELSSRVLNQARIIEGSVRNTGIHACGVIITPDDITKYVPVAKAKDSDMWCTQFDNSVVEDAGLLKMDFLGLKTLTLIKDAVSIVKERHGVELDPDSFPLDDTPTYELFQRGETVGIFQYESPGMQKHMRNLKPTTFADLIAMNALYRPGPLEYIPSFIKRKHGDEEITYDLADMEEYLKETYGITVYQEQVMLLSQKLAGFTKGEADTLRKAMGKKKFDLLEMLKPKFLDQGAERGHDKKTLEKVWKDWEAFASYAFNKSHSTCYAWVAYQTAYLKSNYPAEYMASVLSNNMNNIADVTFFMEECQRMGIEVLGPDVNESMLKFTVNKEGAIRFGMGALKGVGASAVKAIIQEREESGRYNSVFDFARRVDLRACNKKAFESLSLGGCFDGFNEAHRAQFFAEDVNGKPFLENLVRFGASFQESKNSAQVSLFGEASEVQIPEPTIPAADKWSNLETLRREKEVVGIYISGHPLDDFKLELKHFCNVEIKELVDRDKLIGKEIRFAGILSEVAHLTTKNGKPFGKFVIEDYNGSETIFLFGDDYVNAKPYLSPDWFVYFKGKVERNKWKEDGRPDLKIHQAEFLHDLRSKIASKIEVEIDYSQIDDTLVTDLYSLFERNPGGCGLMLTVVDRQRRIKIPMRSKTIQVDITDDLIGGLERMPMTTYNLN